MNVLMLYPKFSGENFWHASRSNKLFLRRGALMPPLGLLTIASYLPEDFHIRLIDRNLADESEQDWNWADVVFLSLGSELFCHGCIPVDVACCKDFQRFFS